MLIQLFLSGSTGRSWRMGHWALVTLVCFAVFERQAHAAWEVQPDPPAEEFKWPDALKFSIPQPGNREVLLFPREESPFCVIGVDANKSDQAEVWDLRTGKRTGQLSGSPPQAFKRSVSADGRFLAIMVLDRARANDVEIWSFETGQLVSTMQVAERTMSTDVMEFLPGNEMVTFSHGSAGTGFVRKLRVWNIESGQVVREWETQKSVNAKHDISPGGRWITWLDGIEVVFFDLKSGKISGLISPPSKTEDGVHVHPDALCFSPDGSELACLLRGQSDWIISVYDVATGEQKLQHELPAAYINQLQHSASYLGRAIDYVAQPAGFLIGGSGFVERESGLMPWTYRQGILEFSHWKRMLTPAGLIVSTGGNGSRILQVLPFPAEQLEKSLAAYRGDEPAIIKPGEKVKVIVKVGEVRFGKPEETKATLEQVIAERLAEDGLEVSDEGSTVLTFKYKEGVGKMLQEFKGGGPLRGNGTPTGRTVQSTAGDVEMLWVTKDGKGKIYNDKFTLDPSMLLAREGEKVDDAAIRDKVFSVLKVQLSGLPMPYFVPVDKALSNLPLVSSSESKPLSKEDALKKKIEAKKAQVKRKK